MYPASIKTLPDQLKAAGYTWKGYEGDMGNDPTREAATCGHPTLNTTDLTQTAEAPSTAVPLGDQYATRHNPFMYFHSIIDSPDCGGERRQSEQPHQRSAVDLDHRQLQPDHARTCATTVTTRLA